MTIYRGFKPRVALDGAEREKIKETSERLAQIHIEKRALTGRSAAQELGRSYVGLLGEYAVTKYLNRYLGASPPVAFNTEYTEGGFDGGRDFEIGGVRFDVKLAAHSKDLILRRLEGWKSDVMIVVWPFGPWAARWHDQLRFQIAGVIPTTHLARHAQPKAGWKKRAYSISPHCLTDIHKILFGIWPDRFQLGPGMYRPPRQKSSGPILIGKAIQDTLECIQAAWGQSGYEEHWTFAGAVRRVRDRRIALLGTEIVA
jgi:hypothetical protein